MNKKAVYYKLKIEIEQNLKRTLTENEQLLICWMAENECKEGCKK